MQIKVKDRVMIMENKDNVHPLIIDKIGTVNLISDYEGTELYYIHMDEYSEELPPYESLNIPLGHCYIAIKDELALIG